MDDRGAGRCRGGVANGGGLRLGRGYLAEHHDHNYGSAHYHDNHRCAHDDIHDNYRRSHNDDHDIHNHDNHHDDASLLEARRPRTHA